VPCAPAEHPDMSVPSRSPLCVIPTFLRTRNDLDVVTRALVSLWGTTNAPKVLVVDDGSPERQLVDLLEAAVGELGFEIVRKEENEGFSRTVNVGLRRALAEGRDAVLVNADIEFLEHGWLDRMLARTDVAGRPAAVVGARLLFPDGCIQHAGVYFSMHHRSWEHRCAFGPAELAEAMTPLRCPVTAALQLIRRDTLEQVGLYDEGFRMGCEDVDYCLRVFAAGLECIYEPAVCAMHHEQAFRGRPTPKIDRWHRESASRLFDKWRTADMSSFTPELV
jgi:GT2 family glycosyltransferase